MPLRERYRKEVGITPATYADEQRRRCRIQKIYSTARQGHLRVNLVEPIDTVLQHLRMTLNEGLNADAADMLIVEAGLSVGRIIGAEGALRFGIGQKVVNLFMKDLWALELISNGTSRLLHAPLDRTILLRIGRDLGQWATWTRVVVDNQGHSDIAIYRDIQETFRRHVQAMPGRFASVIELEQLLWQKY